MPGHSQLQNYGIIRNSLLISFILFVVFALDTPVKMRYDELRLQMIETFAKTKFDGINQSDIEVLKSLMSNTVRRGRTFHYMWKLREAMQRETERLDYVEDNSSKDWIIKAIRPDTYDEDTATFTDWALCNRTWQEPRCKVTRIELVVPLVLKNVNSETTHERTYLEINKYTISSSRGTVNISGADIFDLSNILHKPEDACSGGSLKIKIKRLRCRYVFPNRSMLYEYCNVNSTVLDRFWTFNQKDRTNNNELLKNHHENAEVLADNTTNVKDSSTEEYSSGDETWKTELADELEHKWTDFDDAYVNMMENDINVTDPLIMDVAVSSSPLDSENSENDQSLRPTTHDRKARSPRDEVFLLSQLLKKEELSQDPHRRLKSTRKRHIKKRQLDNKAFRDTTTNERDDENIIKPDRLTGECKRHSFFVHFAKDVNRWDIIMPDLPIDIGYCSNSCRHATHFSNVGGYITAHAVITNSIRGKSPAVSCSPHRMSSVAVMRMNSLKSSLVIEVTVLWNAKIESCWCT